MLKKIKFYGLLSAGIISSAICYKLVKNEQSSPMKEIGTVIKSEKDLKNYNKTYDNKNVVFYNENEKYKEIKNPILIGVKLKEDEKEKCLNRHFYNIYSFIPYFASSVSKNISFFKGL